MGKKTVIIDKNGPIIDSNLIQAKIYPEIVNTRCWLVKGKGGSILRWPRKLWRKKNGLEPKGMFLCHKCDKIFGSCANPDHIFLGTSKDNTHDMIRKKRGGFGKFSNSESARKGWITRKKTGNIGGYKGWETRRRQKCL